MTLSELQAGVISLLSGHGFIAQRLIPVVADDGNYPKIPAREDALTVKDTDDPTVTKGLVVVVWEPECDGKVTESKSGLLKTRVGLHLIVEENQQVNRGDRGFGVTAWEVLEECQKALLGRPGHGPLDEPILAADPPWDNFGRVNGVNRLVANFVVELVVKGTAV